MADYISSRKGVWCKRARYFSNRVATTVVTSSQNCQLDGFLSAVLNERHFPSFYADYQCMMLFLVPLFQEYGIPKHFGLFYAMGIALMMEGVLSACYHVCPNYSNFQFGKWVASSSQGAKRFVFFYGCFEQSPQELVSDSRISGGSWGLRFQRQKDLPVIP